MFLSHFQRRLQFVFHSIILISLFLGGGLTLLAAKQIPQDENTPYHWFSMEDVLQQAEMTALDEIEVDRLGFARFCQQHQIWGSFAERRKAVRYQVRELHRILKKSPLAKQPATGTIFPLLSEAEYNTFPEIDVINTADVGPGSLREAVARAEILNGSRIVFKLHPGDANYNPQTGVWTIRMNSRLFIRSNRTLIDGFSQTRFGGDTNPNGPEIMILSGTVAREFFPTSDGSIFISSVWYLLDASQNWLRGLIFNAPQEQTTDALGAIGIGHTSATGNGYASGNRVSECWIGLSPDGESVFNQYGSWAIIFDRGTK